MAATEQQNKVEEKDPDENCRLRYGLNTHCLTEIFQYLDDTDLIRLSNMNKFYESIIADYVIARKLIIFPWTKSRGGYVNIFQKFGKKIKKMHFIGDPRRFKFLLQNIIEHCAEGQLEEVLFTKSCHEDLCLCEYHYQNVVTPELIGRAIPYFRNVQSVSLRNTLSKMFGHEWHIPQTLFSQSTNMQTLRLDKVLLNEHQLRWDQLTNLHDITFSDLSDFNEAPFIEYLKQRPRLVRFVCRGEMNIDTIGIALATYCGDTIRYFRHYGKNLTTDDIRTRYEFLSKFKHLAHLTITSVFMDGSDLYYPLNVASKNMLQSLEIYQCEVTIGPSTPAEMALIHRKIGEFRQLKQLIINANYTDDKDPQHLQFILNRSILHNVRTLVLSGDRNDINISKIIAFLPNLRQLCVIDLRINNLLLGTRRLVTAIRKLVEKRRTADGKLDRRDFVDVVAHGNAWREFAVYENKYINLANRGSPSDIQDFTIEGTAKIPRLEF